ncbi:MAG TPA: APC family permease [Bryobacteraceae bacterium]|jgi:amino acid transporter|nr:APC family permease [Bryobacteraceae bacterium]
MRSRARKLNLFELAAVTYMMVSGGPYGIEELVGSAGYPLAIGVLLLVPILWSLPVGLMVGELSAAIPADGGYYIWVRRALGPFWGFQEAWLSLAASVFDMTAYLALFVLCLARIWPAATHYSFWIGTGIVIVSVAWNLLGAKPVGEGSLLMTAILLAPFVPLIWIALSHHVPSTVSTTPAQHDFLAGVIAAMWNYMGWDNASTIAAEVENPQRNYPRVMLMALAAICLCYVLPVLAVWHAGIPVNAWDTGSWISIAATLGGQTLGTAMTITALVSTFGIFNSLTLSISRLPFAMAETGCAPRFFARRLANGVPWAAVAGCGILWIAALGLSFDRLLLLDILLYGASLMLEFAALTILRVREPNLLRPFRMPGGTAATILAALGPLALLLLALIESRTETIAGISALPIGIGVAFGGFIAYFLWARSQPYQAPA